MITFFSCKVLFVVAFKREILFYFFLMVESNYAQISYLKLLESKVKVFFLVIEPLF